MEKDRQIPEPAVANAVVVCVTGASWSYLFAPVLMSSLVIVAVAMLWHRFTGGSYPHRSTIR